MHLVCHWARQVHHLRTLGRTPHRLAVILVLGRTPVIPNIRPCRTPRALVALFRTKWATPECQK